MTDHGRQPRWAFWRRRATRREFACVEMVEIVTVYLEGGMDDADRAAFESHIAACPNCSAYLEQMRETLRLVGHIDPETLSAEAEAELLHAFREWRRP